VRNASANREYKVQQDAAVNIIPLDKLILAQMVKKFPVFDKNFSQEPPSLVPNPNQMTPVCVFILSHADPLLSNDREISNYTTDVAK
jgi:hypothetical protein